jgi:hypothetical protein
MKSRNPARVEAGYAKSEQNFDIPPSSWPASRPSLVKAVSQLEKSNDAKVLLG